MIGARIAHGQCSISGGRDDVRRRRRRVFARHAGLEGPEVGRRPEREREGGVDGRWLATAGLGVAILNAAAAGALAHTGILAAEGPLSVLSLMTFLLWTLLAGRALLRPNPAGSAGALARGSRGEPMLDGGRAPTAAATRGPSGTAVATAAHH